MNYKLPNNMFDTSILLDDDISAYHFKINFDQLDEIFKSDIGLEIDKIVELQVKFQSKGQYSINRDLMKTFLDKLYNYSCPNILKLCKPYQQIYLLYLIANLFLRYNDNELQLDKNEYIDRIYFANILTICSKYFPQARRLIHRCLKNVYDNVKSKSEEVFIMHSELYHSDETIIKNDIIQMFFINLFYKYNPFETDTIEELYSNLFQKILYFYLKSKTINIKNCEISATILDNTHVNMPSERYKIYEEALYSVQIQNICSDSGTINRINKQYDEMKSIIIPNELQRLYMYIITEGKYDSKNERITLLKIYNDINQMGKIKNKLPQIYRLLRSVQIISSNKTFLDNDVVLIKQTVTEVLYNKFKNILNDDIIHSIVNNIAETFAISLTSGEFIDMLTLTPVNLSGIKFNQQLKEFLKIVLIDLGELHV